MNTPTQEQLRDPEWWDENAPEWAKSFGFAGIQRLPVFFSLKQYQHVYGNGQSISVGEMHTYSLGDIEHAASRPTKPAAQEWDGEGRPPVNTKCKAVSCHKLRTGTVVWHREGSDVDALVLDEDGFTAFWADTFAPLKTQAEREHEELAELLYNHGMVNRDCDPAADAIIAAGWRKGE